MKRILSLLLAVLLFSGIFFLFPGEAKAAPVTINVYNWGQYISDGTDGYIDVIAEFEKAYPDIRVNYMVYDSNETMYTKLQSGGNSFDVIVPSDYMIDKLIAEDKLEPLDFSNIPNYQYLDDAYKNLAYDPENKYSVPYTWGYVGIIYNPKYVNEDDVGSWDLLWNRNYAGKILMFDNPRDSFAIAEALLGYSINTEDPDELKAAAEKLKEQKNLVQSYVMDQIFDKLEREEAWIGAYYSGDYPLMVEENEALEFNTPEEGFNIFVDALCIPKGCQHKKEAEIFINFLCEPEICGPNLEYLDYATPFSAAKEYTSPELLEDEVLYPPAEVLERGEAFHALSTDATQLMNELWLSVKTQEADLAKYVILTVVALIVCIGLYLFFHFRKKRLKERRGTYYQK